MEEIELPYHMVRRILKEQLGKEVSKEFVLEVKKYLEGTFISLLRNCENKFTEVNELRGFHHIPKMRRFDISIIKKVLAEVNKHKGDFIIYNDGEVAEISRNTTLSQANEVA